MRPWTWLRGVPAALLVVVAGLQFVLTQTADLSPWAGGGFGMFSTTDNAAARHLHVHALWPGVEVEVPPPRSLRDLELRVRLLPTVTHLRELALALAQSLPDPEPPDSVRITLWRTRYDPKTLKPKSELLRELEVGLEQP